MGNPASARGGSGGSGGGAWLGSDVELTSCLFLGNRTGNGGDSTGGDLGNGGNGGSGAGCWTAGAAIANATFHSGRLGMGGSGSPAGASGSGGAIWAVGGTVLNSIAWGNDNPSVDGTTFTLGYSLVQNGIGAAWFNPANCLDVDPEFVDPDAGAFSLKLTSPCKDAGFNLPWMADALDLGGNPRITGGIADMGAYEAVVEPEHYTYSIHNSTVTITRYNGPGGDVTIPSTINGLPVMSIGDWAFALKASLTNLTIPNSVTNIGHYTFNDCMNLKGIYFHGDAPSVGFNPFFGTYNVTVYYLPGATGWEPRFNRHPTALWLPQLQTSDTSFGVRTNQFGFNLKWASGMTVVVEGCTNLANPIWSPLQTNTLIGDSFYFSDPQWTNYPSRFYRLSAP